MIKGAADLQVVIHTVLIAEQKCVSILIVDRHADS